MTHNSKGKKLPGGMGVISYLFFSNKLPLWEFVFEKQLLSLMAVIMADGTARQTFPTLAGTAMAVWLQKSLYWLEPQTPLNLADWGNVLCHPDGVNSVHQTKWTLNLLQLCCFMYKPGLLQAVYS